MSSYKPIDSRRDNFRKYVDTTGLSDCISKALNEMMLMNDWPADPIHHLQKHFSNQCVPTKDKEQIKALNLTIDKYKLRIEELESQLKVALATKNQNGRQEMIDKSLNTTTSFENDMLNVTTSSNISCDQLKTEKDIKVEPTDADNDVDQQQQQVKEELKEEKAAAVEPETAANKVDEIANDNEQQVNVENDVVAAAAAATEQIETAEPKESAAIVTVSSTTTTDTVATTTTTTTSTATTNSNTNNDNNNKTVDVPENVEKDKKSADSSPTKDDANPATET